MEKCITIKQRFKMANIIKYKDLFDVEFIKNSYNKLGLSAIQIAKKINTKPQYVYRFMKFHNISRRNNSQALKNAYNKHIRIGKNNWIKYNYSNIKKEKIKDLYYNDDLTINEVANCLKVSSHTLRILMKKYNIKVKNRNGKNNPHWKSGVMYDGKRKLIYCPEHPKCNFLNNYVYEYRLVVEKELRRYLNKDEIVHHKDGNIVNNSPENLKVMTRSKHINLHRLQGDMK